MKTNDALLKAMREAAESVLEAQRLDQIYGVREGAPRIAAWPERPCNIVFLDFDGVLNSGQSIEQLGTRYRFSAASVQALNDVLHRCDALIVITSTWREHWTLRDNAEFLEKAGVLPNRVVGKTPTMAQVRGVEIDSWLKSAPFQVAAYVIVDDREDMAMHRHRLVRVDPEIGFQSSQALQAIQLLNRP